MPTGVDGVGNEQLMIREDALGKRGRRLRRTAEIGREKAYLGEMQKNGLVKQEPACKLEEEIELATGGSEDRDMNLAKVRNEETMRQDSYEENSIMESKSKEQDSGKESSVMVNSYQPLLLHRAPRYSQF